jgi:two-component system, NarL family, invasion response regulator UvrY
MLRIIIADDHVHIRRGIVQLLEEEFDDLYIDEAGNGIELFTKVMEGSWDLVISDMVMPGGNGLEALKKIKKEKKELPVIIVSTYPAEQYKSRVMEAGADDFISKDAFSNQLISSIHRILKS